MWQPSAPLEHLKIRARLLKNIRDFFNARDVLEVETPLLCHTSVTDPYIESIAAESYYLQTSPEYAMKRLLAAGSGPIYQISKAFRKEEAGRFHNPEFTMLEWYRPGFDHLQLMNEVDELLQITLQTKPADKKTYRDTFINHLQLDPHLATLNELMNAAAMQQLNIQTDIHDRDTWLQLLLSHCIEPQLGQQHPYFIYNFPASQAALAKIQPTVPPVASRFEVYFRGIELANGFHELQNATEQRDRFEKNRATRQTLKLPDMEIDEFFLAALESGLPDCAGVALGVDRLLMLAANANHIKEILSFDNERA